MENNSPVVSMLTTEEDFWKDVCQKVVVDCVFDRKHIEETIEQLMLKYKIEPIYKPLNPLPLTK